MSKSGSKAEQSSDNGSSSLKSSSIGVEHMHTLSELETSDVTGVDFVLRALYEKGDVQSFMKALEKRIRQYDREIEKLCNFHYPDFVHAVQDLVALRKECADLKSEVADADHYLQECSAPLLSVSAEIAKQRKLQRNISAAMDSVSMCLPVLEKFARLNELLQAKKYYPALRTLEQLEHTYLPRVSRYRFGEAMEGSIRGIREKIKDASFNELTDFLENIRAVSKKIGRVALRQTAEQLSQSGCLVATNEELLALCRTDSRIEVSANTEEVDFSAQDMIDFSPVYRCCHIFSVLGARDSFEAYYRKQRREQVAFSLRAPQKIFGSFQSLLNYFLEVIGFFVIEDHVMQTASDLVTRSYRDELWEIAVGHVERILNDHFGQCTDDNPMLPVKSLILLFAQTMKGYGFQVTALYRVLQNFRDQYNEILMAKSCSRFDSLLRTENHACLMVNNAEELRALIERFPLARKVLDDELADKTEPPFQLPFSEFVPAVYEETKRFVHACLLFVENLEMSHTEVQETIRNSVNLLLQRFNGHLKIYVMDEVKQTSLAHLLQITVNVGYLEKSCESLQRYIAYVVQSGGGQQHLIKLKEDVFKDARSEVEQKIDEAMRQKIDEVIGVAQYKWELASCDGRPSEYVTDTINFLTATFLSFAGLPMQLARHIGVQACKYICNRLIDLLVDPEVKLISPGALEQFNLDLMQFEQFVSRCLIAGVKDGTLPLTFADIRQVLDLVMADDWSTYLADFGRPTGRYVRVHPSTAICVLEKIYEYERRRGSSSFGKGKNQDRRRFLETVLKQLKNYLS
ncbi:exocyst complex component 6 [Trichuris trichiura]|uniref:Exocyst complex component n=1 Tax=Trichuris trichiura TaxID=36087 RepID=A0A077YZE0_TRITR|nr:exocyst complex component 6 [Trichuris trichiura]